MSERAFADASDRDRHPGKLYWRQLDETHYVATTLPDEDADEARAHGYLAELMLPAGVTRWIGRLMLRGETVFYAVGHAAPGPVRDLVADAMTRERECELTGLHDPQIGSRDVNTSDVRNTTPDRKGER
jgi:hypothetical protein